MPFKVKDGSGCKLGSPEALIECACRINLCYKLVRNYLTSLIMACIVCKNLLLESPVLHDLRWKLHEIASYRCSCDALVCTLAEKTVKSMSILMEKCLHLVESKE